MNKNDLQSQLTRSEDWVKNADTKIGVLMAFIGVFIVVLMHRFLSIVFTVNSPTYLVVSYVVSLFLVSYIIVKLLLGIIPRLKNDKERKSLLFYVHVKNMKLSNYKNKMLKLTDREYMDALVDQVYIISSIATRKMRMFHDAIILLICAMGIIGTVEIIYRMNALIEHASR